MAGDLQCTERIGAAIEDVVDAARLANPERRIATDALGRIFEPFWRGRFGVGREGLGLGLHICSQIVKAHGGTLTVSSSQADGMTFVAHLPVGGPAT